MQQYGAVSMECNNMGLLVRNATLRGCQNGMQQYGTVSTECNNMGLSVRNATIWNCQYGMQQYLIIFFAEDEVIIAKDKDNAEYIKKLIEESQIWGLNISIPNTEYLNVGSDIRDIKLELNIDIKCSRSFRYLGSIFTSSGKCNEEVLHGTEQARKETRALNSLHWSKYISVNIKKRIFYTERENILNYGWEIWTPVAKLSTEIDFWRRVARISRLLKVGNEVIRERMRVTQTILERMDNIILKYYGKWYARRIKDGPSE
jgi:hypothetical protein